MQGIARVPSLVAVSCAAKKSSPKSYRPIARLAMAGLGYLPDTILTRSVIVNMRRRAPTETVEPYRRRLEVEKGEILRRRLEVWASQISEQIENKWPVMPEGITDRNADVWEALLSVADAAGGSGRNRAVSRLSRLSRFSGEERGALVSVSLPIYAPSSVSGSRYAPKTY